MGGKLTRKNYKTGYDEEYCIHHLHAQSTKILPNKQLRKIKINSSKYYLKTYKLYGKTRINIIMFSLFIRDFFWEPMITLIKKRRTK